MGLTWPINNCKIYEQSPWNRWFNLYSALFFITNIYHHDNHYFIDFYYVQLSEKVLSFFTLSEGLLSFLASQQQETKESDTNVIFPTAIFSSNDQQ